MDWEKFNEEMDRINNTATSVRDVIKNICVYSIGCIDLPVWRELIEYTESDAAMEEERGVFEQWFLGEYSRIPEDPAINAVCIKPYEKDSYKLMMFYVRGFDLEKCIEGEEDCEYEGSDQASDATLPILDYLYKQYNEYKIKVSDRTLFRVLFEMILLGTVAQFIDAVMHRAIEQNKEMFSLNRDVYLGYEEPALIGRIEHGEWLFQRE